MHAYEGSHLFGHIFVSKQRPKHIVHFGFISLSNQEIKEMRRSKSTTPLNFRTQQHLVELSGGRSAFSGHGPCASFQAIPRLYSEWP